MSNDERNRATDVDLPEIELTAKRLATSEMRWHFHIAAGTCRISQGRPGLTFVLEDQDSNRIYRAEGADADRVVGERLARLLHGEDVMGGPHSDISGEGLTTAMVTLIAEAERLSANRQPWHHHMLFPGCAFNPSPDNWTLQLESNNASVEATSIYEPKAALSVIEHLFYSQPAIG